MIRQDYYVVGFRGADGVVRLVDGGAGGTREEVWFYIAEVRHPEDAPSRQRGGVASWAAARERARNGQGRGRSTGGGNCHDVGRNDR